MRESPTLARTRASGRTCGVTGVTRGLPSGSVSIGSLSSMFGAPRPAIGSSTTAIAVTVVPMPAWLGLAIAARKMSPLAAEMASTTCSAWRCVEPSSASRIRSTAMALATSPASCPPMPSATTNTPSATYMLSSFWGRIWPGWEPAPQRSSAISDRRPCAQPLAPGSSRRGSVLRAGTSGGGG